jgi:hypothetical protein
MGRSKFENLNQQGENESAMPSGAEPQKGSILKTAFHLLFPLYYFRNLFTTMGTGRE